MHHVLLEKGGSNLPIYLCSDYFADAQDYFVVVVMSRLQDFGTSY